MRSTSPARVIRAGQFLRFCVVGAVGFAVDACVLLAVLRAFGPHPIAGRLVSFSVAVLCTFELNRFWAFRSRGRRRRAPALASYLGVQGVGFLCNFSVYALLTFALPPGLNAPLLCLAVASALALVVNYAGASLVVFRSRPGDAPTPGP